MNKCCDSCYYSDECLQDEVCEDYTPVNDTLDDIDDIIEQDGIDFRRQWFQYIEYFNK